jgi:hypothetical protein
VNALEEAGGQCGDATCGALIGADNARYQAFRSAELLDSCAKLTSECVQTEPKSNVSHNPVCGSLRWGGRVQ